MGKSIVLAAGGTGGHIFPAQALADLLVDRGFKSILICDDRAKPFLYSSLSSIERYQISASGLQAALQGNFLANIFAFRDLIWNTWKVLFYLLKIKPACVVGFGGYPAFPTMFAATMLGVPIVIHEPNAYLGRVNKYFLPFAKALTIAIPNTLGIKDQYKPKVHLIGNPIRRDIAYFKSKTKQQDEKFTIMVIGGSQGAQIFSEILPLTIKKLPEVLQERLKVFQQVRQNLVDQTTAAYTGSKVEVIINSFFENMSELYSQADLIICRSGASTISELLTTKTPAILVPYPHAMDNHQFYNAKYLVDAGCATLSLQENFSPEKLAQELIDFMENAGQLKRMVDSYNKLGNKDGTVKLLEIVLKNFRN